MTNQIPDELINEFSEIDFGNLNLDRIVTGNVTTNALATQYPFKTQPKPEPSGFLEIWSHLRRGYVAHFGLKANGELLLEYYEFPQYINAKPQVVNEILEGDFWLVMRESFNYVYVPFRSGKVVSEKSEWVYR